MQLEPLLERMDGLSDAISFWDSYIESVLPISSYRYLHPSDCDHLYNIHASAGNVLSAILVATTDCELDKFNRLVLLACGVVHYVLEEQIPDTISARALFDELRVTFFAQPASRLRVSDLDQREAVDAPKSERLGIREARQLYVALVHTTLMDMALRQPVWLSYTPFVDTYTRVCHAMGIPLRHSVIYSENFFIEGAIFSGFLTLFAQIVSWRAPPVFTATPASLTGLSWISVVQHIHVHASASAGHNRVAELYIGANEPSARLQPQPDLAQLLRVLAIKDCMDLDMKSTTASEFERRILFDATRPRYRPLFIAYPDLVNMLYTFCVTLVEPRNITMSSFHTDVASSSSDLQSDHALAGPRTASHARGGPYPTYRLVPKPFLYRRSKMAGVRKDEHGEENTRLDSDMEEELAVGSREDQGNNT